MNIKLFDLNSYYVSTGIHAIVLLSKSSPYSPCSLERPNGMTKHWEDKSKNGKSFKMSHYRSTFAVIPKKKEVTHYRSHPIVPTTPQTAETELNHARNAISDESTSKSYRKRFKSAIRNINLGIHNILTHCPDEFADDQPPRGERLPFGGHAKELPAGGGAEEGVEDSASDTSSLDDQNTYNGSANCVQLSQLPGSISDNQIVHDVSPPASPSITVAILAKDYPLSLLLPSDAQDLCEAIMDQVSRGWTFKVKFNDIQYRSGFILVECVDLETCDWVMTHADKLPAWHGVPLDFRLAADIPDPILIKMALHRSAGQNPLKSLALIAAQNDDLNVDYWTVSDCVDDDDEEENQRLTVVVDLRSMEHLLERGYIYYRFGTVRVEAIKQPTNGA